MTADLSGLLDRLEAAAAAATPGPWATYEQHGRDWSDEAWSFLGIRSITGTLPQVAQTHPLTMDGESEQAHEDAALIVAAVNALPTLIAELRAHQAAVQAVRELADSLVGEARKAARGSDPELAHPYINAAQQIHAAVAALDPKGQDHA